MLLQGKNAIVTGARSGIGLATVHQFAQNGCNVWAVVHREDIEFQTQISKWEKENNVWIKPIFMDLSDSSSIKQGMKAILKDKITLDILVNAAGLVSPNRLFSMTKMEDMRKVMEINFFSVMELSQLVSRTMMRQHKGNIINISSIAAWGEDTSQIEYAASKAAVVIATKKMARELGVYGIRVNSVAPGLTETKMITKISEEHLKTIKKGNGMHRLALPEEVAELCVFLASDKAQYLTGETIKVDGGGFSLRLLSD